MQYREQAKCHIHGFPRTEREVSNIAWCLTHWSKPQRISSPPFPLCPLITLLSSALWFSKSRNSRIRSLQLENHVWHFPAKGYNLRRKEISRWDLHTLSWQVGVSWSQAGNILRSVFEKKPRNSPDGLCTISASIIIVSFRLNIKVVRA